MTGPMVLLAVGSLFAGVVLVQFLPLGDYLAPVFGARKEVTHVVAPLTISIALFLVMVAYGLFNSLTGLVLIYIAAQMPLTIFILMNFYARLPPVLFDAAKIDVFSVLDQVWRTECPLSPQPIVPTVMMNHFLP